MQFDSKLFVIKSVSALLHRPIRITCVSKVGENHQQRSHQISSLATDAVFHSRCHRMLPSHIHKLVTEAILLSSWIDVIIVSLPSTVL